MYQISENLPVQECRAVEHVVVLVITDLDASWTVPDEGTTQPLGHLTCTHTQRYSLLTLTAWWSC